MKICTTFDDTLYTASASKLLQSIDDFLPDAELHIYEECEQGHICQELYNYESLSEIKKVTELETFKKVFSANKDIIPKQDGGNCDYPKSRPIMKTYEDWEMAIPLPFKSHSLKPEGFNKRWFNWFRKVAMYHDVICNQKYDDYVVFFDCDMRVLKPFDSELFSKVLKGSVGVFKGEDRAAIEAGMIIVKPNDKIAREYFQKLMDIYIDKSFRNLPRWDDGFVMTVVARSMNGIQDFAEGLKSVKYKNSNGYKANFQIICETIWKDYVEHDKGKHARLGV